MRPISLLRDQAHVGMVVEDVAAPSALADIITTGKWSPAKYREGHRTKANASDCGWLVYDIDGGLPIEEAVRRVKNAGLAHLIGASQNHQREKNGVVADRYRVCLPLEESIHDPLVYESTWEAWAEQLGLPADRAARDISRYWNPCRTEPMWVEDQGDSVEVVGPRPREALAESTDTINEPVPYAEAAIRAGLHRLRQARDGEKHRALASVAYSMGRLSTLPGVNGPVLFDEVWKCVLGWGDRVRDLKAAEKTAREQFALGSVSGYRAAEPEPQALGDQFDVPAEIFLGEDIEPPRDIVWKLQSGQLAFLYGGPNSSKTWLALELSRQAAESGFRVLYVVEEGHPSYLQKRVRWMRFRPDYVRVAVRKGFNLMKPDWVEMVKKRIAETETDLLVLDPLSDIMDGIDESDPEAMHRVRDAMKDIVKTTDCCLLVLHHSSKMGARGGTHDVGPSMFNMRGHSILAGAADLMVELRQSETEDRVSSVDVPKNRNGSQEYGGRLELHVNDGDGSVGVTFLPGGEGKARTQEVREEKKAEKKTDRESDQEVRVLEALQGKTEPLSARSIQEAAGMKFETARRTLERLERAGVVRQDRDGWSRTT
jgi:KaiC/GvpD/RAD55 family RecA-like ATPase